MSDNLVDTRPEGLTGLSPVFVASGLRDELESPRPLLDPAVGQQGAHQSSVSVETVITVGDVCVSAGSSSDKTSNHNRNAVCLLLSCYL